MSNVKTNSNAPIAIVGIGAIFPGHLGRDGFWRDIVAGRDNITEVPPTHWLIEDYYDADPAAPDKTYCRRGGFIAPVDFDPVEFGIPPTALPSTDTAQLLALVVAKQVLQEASRTISGTIDRSRTSVVLGVASATELVVQLGGRLQRPAWLKGLREAGVPEDEAQRICDRIASNFTPWQESSFPGMLGNVVAGRIANRLDLGGTNCVTDAACASSISALQVALNELHLGQSDMVISGGVDALNEILMYMCFSKTPAFSPTGDCRPFSSRADGTIIGEGIGMFALRRLDDAERDGNSIYAVICGLGSSSDGRSTSIYAPRPEGQAQALLRAYDAAGYGPGTVELMEAHGTATITGDAAEFASLRAVFEPDAKGRQQWCALGSIKSQIGHTKAAAGAAGLFKTVMALHHKVLPPTIKVDRPNPGLNVEDSPFFINTKPRPWIRGDDHPRRASVSSFGFGGSNFHVTLEEYTGPSARPPRTRVMGSELILLSAAEAGGLLDRCRDLISAGDGATPLASSAEQSQRAFDPSAQCRLAIVARSIEDLVDKLNAAVGAFDDGEIPTGPDVNYGQGQVDVGKIAFLFPGQGSQYVDMGADLAMAFEDTRAVWDAAAGMEAFIGAPLHRVVFPRPAFGDEERAEQRAAVTAMAVAQPGIAAVSLSQLALLERLGLRADATAGHSFGEVTALHAAGVFDGPTTLFVARQRGLLMTEAAAGTEGAMTAVSADHGTVAALLADHGLDLVLANDNSPKQVILSGAAAEIERVEALLKEVGLVSTRLSVATAFHSKIVSTSREPFAEMLDQVAVGEPAIPVYANATAAPYPRDAGSIRRQLADQLAEPVRFRETVERMYEDGVRLFVEVGPGAVLCGLVKQCLDGRPHAAVCLDRKGQDGLLGLWRVLARLSALGVALDFAPLWDGLPPGTEEWRDPLPHAVKITGANYGKPYPPPGGAVDLPPPNPSVGSNQHEEFAITRASKTADERWVATFEEFQRQTADAHRQFQQSMAEGHQAFLRMMERTLAVMTGGEAAETDEAPYQPMPLPPGTAQPTTPSRTWPAVEEWPEVSQAVPVRVPQPPAPPLPVMSNAEAPAPPPFSAGEPDVGTVLLNVVAEKTGYPMEMLDFDMELEAELGIDSIKQVEILSSLRDRMPALPEVEPAQLAELKTLAQIVAFIGGPVVGPEISSAAAAQTGDGGNVETMLLDVVAEKTGYPVEMLDLDMELEAELGIDSIKQVEILSALRSRAPDLPEIEPAQLAELRTLTQIIDFLDAMNAGQIVSRTKAPAEGAAVSKPSSEPVAEPAPVAKSLGRYVPMIVDASAAGFAMPGLRSARCVAVTPEGGKLGKALVSELQGHGIAAELCPTPPSAADAVICLDGLAKPAGARVSSDRHWAALAAGRQVAGRFTEKGGVFVTVQDTGGDFGLERDPKDGAWLGGFAALVKTMALEWPKAAVKAIDIRRGRRSAAALARDIVGELLGGGPEIEVGLGQNGRRVTVSLCHVADQECGESALDDGAVVVVSGGGRGVTAKAIEQLAARRRLRFVLLGRTPLDAEHESYGSADSEATLKAALFKAAKAEGRTPGPIEISHEAGRIMAVRDIRATIERLGALNSEARYLKVDVTDCGALTDVLAGVRSEWGGISALIHGAGVLADKLIAEKTDEQFRRVFATKVTGLDALLTVMRDDPLRLICMFSSVAARAGNPGQSDYAMANEVLNKVAQAEARRRGKSCVVKSINWGPWDGGMVDDALRAHFKRTGVQLIPVDEGATFLERELSKGAPGGSVEVLAGSAFQAGGRPARVEVLVDGKHHPYLSNHAIKGKPVLPVVLVVEWFMRAARAALPDTVPLALRDLHALKGIVLERYPEGEYFEIQMSPLVTNGTTTIEMQLVSEDGRVRYRAAVEMGRFNGGGAEVQFPLTNEDFNDWPYKLDEVYGDKLFHGPDFQVIRELEGISADGGVGVFEGTVSKNWPGGPWLTDPAALDGGMQLALLWGLDKAGRVFLPIRIGAFIPHGPSPAAKLLRCAFRSRLFGNSRTENDLTFTTLDGRVVAELQGVEMYPVDSTQAKERDGPEQTET